MGTDLNLSPQNNKLIVISIAKFGIIVSGIITLDYYFALIRPIVSSKGSVTAKAVLLGYLVGDALLLIPVVFILLTLRYEYTIWPWKMVAAGILIRAAGDSFYIYQVFFGTYKTGALIDLSWILSYLIIGATSLLRMEQKSREISSAVQEESREAA